MSDPAVPPAAATPPATPSPASTAAPPPATDPPAPPSATTPPTEDLGDAGKRALAAERKAAEDARRETAAARQELDKLRAERMTDQERAVAEAEARGRSSATAELLDRIFLAEVRAAASTRLTDDALAILATTPAAALAILGLEKVPATTDGRDVDSAAIAAAIDSLTTNRPTMARTAGATPPPPPKVTGPADAGQGATSGQLLTREQLETMTQREVADLERTNSRLLTDSLAALAAKR